MRISAEKKLAEEPSPASTGTSELTSSTPSYAKITSQNLLMLKCAEYCLKYRIDSTKAIANSSISSPKVCLASSLSSSRDVSFERMNLKNGVIRWTGSSIF